MKMITLLYCLLISLYTLPSRAEDRKKINLSDLKINTKLNENDSSIMLKESLVYINNEPYQQIEYQNQFFYMKLSSPANGIDANREECLRRPKDPPPERIKFVYGQGELKSRSSFFIKSLTIHCGEQLDWQKFISKLQAIKMGISIPDQNADMIKDKSIYLAPFQKSLNVEGSF